VPAVAVIRRRRALFILNRFKGYPNGQNILNKKKYLTRVRCEETVLEVERLYSVIPRGLVKAQAVFYVITDVGGRRHRARTGFDTPVVFADNDECHELDYKFSFINENESISPQE